MGIRPDAGHAAGSGRGRARPRHGRRRGARRGADAAVADVRHRGLAAERRTRPGAPGATRRRGPRDGRRRSPAVPRRVVRPGHVAAPGPPGLGGDPSRAGPRWARTSPSTSARPRPSSSSSSSSAPCPSSVTGRDPRHETAAAEKAGLAVTELRTARCRMEFFDIGAVVWILRKCVWWVPDFSVERYHDKLVELDARHPHGGSVRRALDPTPDRGPALTFLTCACGR